MIRTCYFQNICNLKISFFNTGFLVVYRVLALYTQAVFSYLLGITPAFAYAICFLLTAY
jgi:hypothetical protein